MFNIDLPLHISFDENVNPYPALTIWQVDDKDIKQIYEICLKSPRNKLVEVVKEFRIWAKSHNFENVVYIYGDASSQRDDTKLEKGINYFSLLKKELDEHFITKIRKSSKNPPVQMRGEFINAIFASNYEGWSITINERCKESINDYLLVQERSDGSMNKTKKDGVELYGHITDCAYYFICEIEKKSFNNYKSRSKKKDGYKFFGIKDKSY